MNSLTLGLTITEPHKIRLGKSSFTIGCCSRQTIEIHNHTMKEYTNFLRNGR